MGHKRKAATLTMVAALLGFSGTATNGDQPRRQTIFRSDDGRFELRLLKGGEWDQAAGSYRPENWGLYILASGERRYELSGRLSPKSVFFAADGSALAAVDDYSSADWSPDVEVLTFYRDGLATKTYSLGEVLSPRLPVSSSASHFDWLVAEPRNDGTLITLTTHELITYTFDLHSGDLISRVIDPRLSDGSVYVYGPVEKLQRGVFRIQVICPLGGPIRCNDEIEFKCPKPKAPRPISSNGYQWGADRLEHKGYYAVILRDGVCVAHEHLIVNTCNCGREPE